MSIFIYIFIATQGVRYLDAVFISSIFKTNKEVMNAFPKMSSNTNSGLKVWTVPERNETYISLLKGSREKALSDAFQDHGAKVNQAVPSRQCKERIHHGRP